MARDIKVGSYVKVVNDQNGEYVGMKGTIEAISPSGNHFVRFDNRVLSMPFSREEIAPANRKRNA